MTPFSVYILGCGSAMPTMHHNPTSQVVSLRNKQFMVDCGEGTQLQLRKARIHFMKIEAVFISHLHGDHCLGLVGMMSTFGMLGRTAPLHIYAHEALEPLLEMERQLFCDKLEYDVVFHPIDTERETVVYDDKSLSVSTLPLDHRIPCCGFLFREKPTLPHIRRDMIDYLEIPVSQINNIKMGADWTRPDGTVVPNSDLVVPSEKPLRMPIAPTRDTCPSWHSASEESTCSTTRAHTTPTNSVRPRNITTAPQHRPPSLHVMPPWVVCSWATTAHATTTRACCSTRPDASSRKPISPTRTTSSTSEGKKKADKNNKKCKNILSVRRKRVSLHKLYIAI